MEYRKLKDINKYKTESINPSKKPDTIFEMYSVPIYETGHPEYLRGDEIASNKVIVKKHDILLCKINPRINRVWVVADESEYPNVASSEWIVIRTDKYNPEYLAWYFRSHKFQNLMTSEVTGIGGSLTRAQPKRVAEYPVPIISREQQDSVTEVLNRCKFIIEARERELADYDNLIKARFVELIRNSEYKHIVKMKDVVSEGRIITYGIVKPGPFVEGGQPVIKVKDFPNGEVLTDDILHCSPEIEKKYLRSRVRTGDLLYSIRGSVGRMAFVPKELDGANLTQDTARISVGEGYNPIYIRGVLDLPEIKHQVNMQIKGVAVKGISLAELREIEIPIVDKVLQDQIGEFVKQVDKSKVAA